MSRGLVFDLRKFSVHDGPGIRTTVFLKGCPLRCVWCHNPEGLATCPELLRRPDRCIACGACLEACPLDLDPRSAAGGPACSSCPDFGICAGVCPAEAIQTVGRSYEAAELMAVVGRDRPFYEDSGGGVTFSGGEPLAQPDFLFDCLALCRAGGIHSAVDSSGLATEELVLKLGMSCDLVLFDLKLMDSVRHRRATGHPNEVILGNLRALAREIADGRSRGERVADLVLRMPVIPGINDAPSDVDAAALFAASLPVPVPVNLLPYHDAARGKYRLRGTDYELEGLAPPNAKHMDELVARFTRHGVTASIGG
ncbi:MAG TPA: glycyl-radical enzyme activating protein [Rectinemataceae bacterium]|nr:glycyl-radical enzyme activating protein [Rectinemataceae bacterium]